MSQLASVSSTGDSTKIAFHPDQLISRITKCVKAIFDVIKTYPDVLCGAMAIVGIGCSIGYAIWINTPHQKFKAELAEASRDFREIRLSKLLDDWVDKQILYFIKHRESQYKPEDYGNNSWASVVCGLYCQLKEKKENSAMSFVRDPTRLRLDLVCSLPDCLSEFSNITRLELDSERFCLFKISENIGGLKQLEKLKIRNGGMEDLPQSIGNLDNLKKLVFIRCYKLTELPESIGNLSNLKELDLRGCEKLIKLPDSLFQLSSHLSVLYDTSNQELHEQIQGVINQPGYNGPSFNTYLNYEPIRINN